MITAALLLQRNAFQIN